MAFHIVFINLGKDIFILLKNNKKLFFFTLFSFYQLLNITDGKQIAQNYAENYPIIGSIFKAIYKEEKAMYPTPSKEQMATSALSATEFANSVRFIELRDKGLLAFSSASLFQKLRTIYSLFDLHPTAFLIKKSFQFLFFSYFLIKLAKNISKHYSNNNKK